MLRANRQDAARRASSGNRPYKTPWRSDRGEISRVPPEVLGARLAQQGKLVEAEEVLRAALKRDSRSSALHNNLGMVLHELGRDAEAITSFRAALDFRPSYPIALNNLGMALAAAGQTEEAIEQYEAAIAIQPDYPEALNNLGYVQLTLERREEALSRFDAALALRPGFAEALIGRGRTLCMLGRYGQAIPCYRAALRAQPESAAIHTDLADALRELNRHADAVAHFQRAIALEPRLATAHLGLGIIYQEIGDMAAARRCFETVVAIEPDRPRGYLRLMQVRKFERDNPYLASLEAIMVRGEFIEDEDWIEGHFALGRAFADIGEHQRAFGHFTTGNRLKRAKTKYDEAATLNWLTRVELAFSREMVEGHRGESSASPIFIVGMPRSGSTLIEQVLASHPNIAAIGESRAFREALWSCGLASGRFPYPESVRNWTDEQLSAAAADYMQRTRRLAKAVAGDKTFGYVVNKSLNNFRYIGLIHMMFPRARIIHTYRDPIDTCLSCFSINFAGVAYSFDLAELGRYYAAYRRLMDHWRKILPRGTILEVQHELLVDNFEDEVRRLLTYCGVEWDAACLRYHETRRSVRTASVTQVRQPLFKSSTPRWRPNAEVLQPLLSGLAGTAYALDHSGKAGWSWFPGAAKP